MHAWPPSAAEIAILRPRFERKVQKGAPGECWPWVGARTKAGYGHMFIRGRERTSQRWEREFLCHRLALCFAGVDVPTDKFVLHSCDNKWCVNPAHLRVGGASENMFDRSSRNRESWARGEGAPGARITSAAAQEIRRRHAAGESQGRLSKEYGIAQTTVSALVRGATWAHL